MDIDKYVVNSKLKIKVTSNSEKTEIKGYDESTGTLLVNITEQPEKNKANMEVIKFFSKLSKKRVLIKTGMASREKTLIFY